MDLLSRLNSNSMLLLLWLMNEREVGADEQKGGEKQHNFSALVH